MFGSNRENQDFSWDWNPNFGAFWPQGFRLQIGDLNKQIQIITGGLWIKWYVRFFDSKSIWSLPPKDQALNLNSSLRKISLESISVVTRLPSDLCLNTIRLVTRPVSDLSTNSEVTRPMSDLDTSSVVTRLGCTLEERQWWLIQTFISQLPYQFLIRIYWLSKTRNREWNQREFCRTMLYFVTR